MQELLGGGKEKESLRSLLRARRFLNLKFGNIVVVFGQPIDVQVWPQQRCNSAGANACVRACA